ncbi:MAG: hypothetical protein WAL64_02360 [Candidatus Dormiibacterota bacterium]
MPIAVRLDRDCRGLRRLGKPPPLWLRHADRPNSVPVPPPDHRFLHDRAGSYRSGDGRLLGREAGRPNGAFVSSISAPLSA